MYIKNLILKNREIISYLFFGVATTIINIFSYYLCARILKVDILISTTIAWIISVIFAYVTNKIWVFKSKVNKFREVVKEFVAFIAFRVASGGVDILIMFVFVTLLEANDMYVKVLSNVLVVVLNYIASKLVIFRNKPNKENENE